MNKKEVEVWVDISTLPGYELFIEYKVSNYGNIESTRCKKEKILSQPITSDGYRRVYLSPRNNKNSCPLAHTLVALAFVSGHSKECCQVNHIDECKTNNYYKNLEWCNPKHNSTHGTRIARIQQTKYKKKQATKDIPLDKVGTIEYYEYSPCRDRKKFERRCRTECVNIDDYIQIRIYIDEERKRTSCLYAHKDNAAACLTRNNYRLANNYTKYIKNNVCKNSAIRFFNRHGIDINMFSVVESNINNKYYFKPKFDVVEAILNGGIKNDKRESV